MNKKTWLFDLDNTLHLADAGIFQLINREMTRYLAEKLHLDLQAASDVRTDYWQRYGATLAGLAKHHPHIDIMDFLRQSHPLAEISQLLVAECHLPHTLSAIEGQKAIFSNGPSFYVQHIMRELSIAPYFQAAFGCDDFDMCYKPNPQAYHTVCALLNVRCEDCMMVDDSLANLQTAKTLGMTAIYVDMHKNAIEIPPFVDHTITDLRQLTLIDNTLIKK